ncbi:MAG: SagB/ThcOx family dehydrogenase [bacterium]
MKKTINQQILDIHKLTSSFDIDFKDLNPEIVSMYAKKVFFKSYPRFNRIKLEKPSNIKVDFLTVLKNRETKRDFDRKNGLIKSEISTLLYYSLGLKQENIDDYDLSTRFYPSAGAKYPIEAYVYVNKYNDISEGLYHYNVKEHSLENMNFNMTEETLDNINPQELILNSPITIFLSFAFTRTTNKYSSRGYRFLYLDCGHMSQNIVLLASAMNLKACLYGGFDDKLINNILDLKSNEEFIGYVISLGK